jgi:LPS O-antigen subunit length determinant protein (WzzB/FepE family)
MTEKENPLSAKPYQDQNFKHEPEDEVNLLDLLEFLIRKKAIIFYTASIFIVLSIFYAFSIKTIYLTTIGFQPSEKNLISLIPFKFREVLPSVSRSEKGVLVTKKNYMLNKFISELQSYSNQEKVFMEGKFYERFVASNPKINMKEGIVQEINRSIHESNGGGLSAKVVSYEMNGANPELAADFLNALAVWVKNKVEHDIRDSIKKGIKNYIDVLSGQLNSLNSDLIWKYESKIRDLKFNIEMAKKLGILDNNLQHYQSPQQPIWYLFGQRALEQDLDNNLQHYQSPQQPIWYLFGQRALEQELNLLELRGSPGKNIKEKGFLFNYNDEKKSEKLVAETDEISELILKIEQLSSFDISKINIEPVIISQTSIPSLYTISTKKFDVIAVGIALGLFIGILMAVLSSLMENLKKRSKLLP